MKTSNAFQASVLAFGVALLACGTGTAQATESGKPIACNVQPGQKWLGEKKIKEIFGASDYMDVNFTHRIEEIVNDIENITAEEKTQIALQFGILL